MNPLYRDLLKHSGIYGLGQILSRVASLVLLPLYTRFLTPADYGCIAVLDLTNTVLGILIGAGIAQAVNRFHFDTSSEEERNHIWWTAVTIVLSLATLIVIPAWIGRSAVAHIMLGSEQAHGTLYFALTLPTLWFGSLEILLQTYVQVRKWSVAYVIIALARLGVNIALNVVLLVVFNMGILGILIGNLVTGALAVLVLLWLFVANQARYDIRTRTLAALWSYGSPLIITTFAAFLMHQADRYFLRLFLDLEQVGIYSLAYQIGQGINAMVILSFGSIWNVLKFEIADRPEAKELYATVFKYFTFGLMLLLLAVSLFTRPILMLIVTPAYLPAADIIPIICLGYVFFSMTSFVTLPAVLHNRTKVLILPSLVAAGVNLAGNALLIPLWGTMGAGWVTVITFITFVLSNHLVCRNIAVIKLGLPRVIGTLGIFVLVYGVFRLLCEFPIPTWLPYAVGGGAWLIFVRLLVADALAGMGNLVGIVRHKPVG